MSATDELRRLLDERGVRHQDIVDATLWTDSNGNAYTAAEVYTRGNTKPSTKRLVIRHMATPEQAIATTLGSGECHFEYHHGEWYCTGCGIMVGTCDPDSELCVDGNYVSMWSYCPNCGREVVDE